MDILVEKNERGVVVVNTQKGASMRGKGGHRLTGEKWAGLQMQVKKVVKDFTSQNISLDNKVVCCISIFKLYDLAS